MMCQEKLLNTICQNGDYTDCLSNLMRYPSGVDVIYIVQYALYLKNPQLYPRPDSIRKPCLSYLSSKYNANAAAQPHQEKGTPQWFPEKSHLNENGDYINYISSSYSVDDPGYLKKELEEARLIINTAHQKLVEFYSTLKNSYQNNISMNVEDILDEIYGVSCLLQKHIKGGNVEIETACEAGEIKESKIANSEHPKLENLNPPITSVNSDQRSVVLKKMKKCLKSGELKVFKQHVGGTMNGAPMADPLHLIKI